jgi:hypothetical protein
MRILPLLLLVLVHLLPLPRAMAGEVCADDVVTAASAIKAFHQSAGEDLLMTRSIGIERAALDEIVAAARGYLDGRPGQAVLVYGWDERDFCVLLFVPGGGQPVYVRHAGKRQVVEAGAQELRLAISAGLSRGVRRAARLRAIGVPEEISQAAVSDLPDPLKRLSQLLFPAELAPRLAETKGLTIVPVGPLATLPLYAMDGFGKGPVIDRYTLTLLPLLADLKAKPLRFLPGFQNMLVMANGTPADHDFEFPSLPGTLAEAQHLQGLFKGHIFEGQEAEHAIYDTYAPKADLIVMATHGVADPQSPMDGGFLALGDGRLTARTIQQLPLDALPVVVLSACQSGLGRTMDAGIVGVARAFHLAGAATTVMSLWNVDDESAAYLMTRFYDGMNSLEPAQALRQAAIETRKTYPGFSHWAAFASFGPAMVDN